MKRVVAIISLAFAVAMPASASPELASDWGKKAAELYDQTVAIREGERAPARYNDELARFSVTASRLARWIDAEGGPADLGCIFRGMADESEAQLGALESGRKDVAIDRLTLMFSDAELISAASIRAVTRNARGADDMTGSCPARPMSRDQYFTDHP